ncbi:Uncharacterized protein Rs2_32899 [Raphanus sativus]|nr:Uncharacterized protein Rs2_32899 [Raphanus sativus]
MKRKNKKKQMLLNARKSASDVPAIFERTHSHYKDSAPELKEERTTWRIGLTWRQTLHSLKTTAASECVLSPHYSPPFYRLPDYSLSVLESMPKKEQMQFLMNLMWRRP